MDIKRHDGKIYGVKFNVSEQKAIDKEIKSQLAEYVQQNIMEVDATILWILHSDFGFGKKKLRRFYDNFIPSMNSLIERYQAEDDDPALLCAHMLRNYGVDINQWRAERKENNERE